MILAQALRHRHRWDADNALLAASFTLDWQVLDLGSGKQPQYCVLPACWTKIASLIWFVFHILLGFLQHFPPHLLLKIANKKPAPLSHTAIHGTGSQAQAQTERLPTCIIPVLVRDRRYVCFLSIKQLFCLQFSLCVFKGCCSCTAPQFYAHNLCHAISILGAHLYLCYYTHFPISCQFLECTKQT